MPEGRSRLGAMDCNEVSYSWMDISCEFGLAVQDLALGELLHDQMFGLYEAMSAIEMMDPKMDAGMQCNRGSQKPMNFEQALQAQQLKVDGLEPRELISIVDTLLSCVVSWLEGHSLAQTVFTCLYMHKPYAVDNKLLRSYCICMYKVLDVVKEIISKALVFEEEDYQPLQHGYRLNPDMWESKAVALLREVEDEWAKKFEARTKEDPAPEEFSESEAVHSRVKFFRLFYQLLTNIASRCKEDKPVETAECKKILLNMQDCLHVMSKTWMNGIVREPGVHGEVPGFEPLVNQRLLPPTFPRYTKIKSRPDMVRYFEEMVDRFKSLITIPKYNVYHSALNFFLEFSKKAPCLLTRSSLQLMYFGSGFGNLILGQYSMVELLKESVKAFISPPCFTNKGGFVSSPQARGYVDAFIVHCMRPFVNLVTLCGHNRARQRDKLAQILEEFSSLQDEAERVDAYLHTLSMKSENPRPHLACFGTWILYYTLKVMIMYLLSGFELELYSVHEYYYIFWYLYEFLYGWLVSAVNRAETFLQEQDVIEARKRIKKSKSLKKTKPRQVNREVRYYQALQNMCGGYYKAITGLRMDSKIQAPKSEFANEKVRYEHRFSCFAALLTPPPVLYDEFKEMTSPERFHKQPLDSDYLYAAGCKHFHQARNLLESINGQEQEVIDLIKICKNNFVVLKLMADGHKKDRGDPLEFDFHTHRHFPIFKIS